MILIRWSGGGGIVLLVVLALLIGHSSGINTGLAVALIMLLVVVIIAVIVTAVTIVRRLVPKQPSGAPVPVIRVSPEPGTLAGTPRALDAPVRLPDDQLEQLAELIRRNGRPD